MAGIKKGTEIATIDVSLVTFKTGPVELPVEIAIDTASKVGVTTNIETVDAAKLIIKGKLKAQKPPVNTITGTTLVMTDNVFTPEVAKMVQGGTVVFDAVETTKIKSYTPPVVGSNNKGDIFEVCCYSARYGANAVIIGYEKITYPNCQGVPINLSSEDGVFRAPEYTINSAPAVGQAPYVIDYVDALPVVA